MLPPSSSITGERLRRAKSTSSANTSSSGRRQNPPTDRFVIRQTAETAATEAYRRAQPHEQAMYPGYRPVPPRLQRRKSQVTGRSEGSHLEDARLGRRRSTAKREESSSSRQQDPQARCEPPVTVLSNKDGDIVVTRKRTVMPPHPLASRPATQERPGQPATDRRHRKAASTYQNGSPAPRSTPAFQDGGLSALSPPSRYTEKSYDEGLSIRYKVPQTYAHRTSMNLSNQTSPMPRASIRETQTDEEIVALARDRCLQDFHQKRLRERKSFFGSIQKLQKRGSSVRPTSAVGYDSSVPPYNYADDSMNTSMPPPADPEPPLVFPEDTVQGNRKPRIFSASMKGRLKQLLRKPSRAPSGLPAQHIEAKHLHYSVADHGDSPTQPSQSTSDPFIEADRRATTPIFVPPAIHGDSVNSKSSLGDRSSAARSRVTSWANSTVAGTVSTVADHKHAREADEHGRLRQTGSMSTLRKKSSFFGRSIQNRLRKPSRAELKSSEETSGLYSALQERFKSPPRPFSDAQPDGDSPHGSSPNVTGLADLPSQSRSASTTTSLGQRRPSTIRQVSPEANLYNAPMMSPLLEASPDRPPADSTTVDTTATAHPKSRHIASTIQAAPLSQDQLARRVQRTRDRWQGPLDAVSPPAPRHTSLLYGDDNPYDLPSLRQRAHDTGGLPTHAKVYDKPPAVRGNILSPSLYSRATDGASPRPETPDEGGMMITITSREVKRYSLSPPKRAEEMVQRPVQGSREWRKWLSDEMNGSFEPGRQEDFALAQEDYGHIPAAPGGVVDESIEQDYAMLEDSTPEAEQRPKSPAAEEFPKVPKTQRPRASSRRSSGYMNERYPIVESSRTSSRQSAMTGRKVSFAGVEGTRSRNVSITGENKQHVREVVQQAPAEAPRRVSKRHSLAQMVMGSRNKSVTDAAGIEATVHEQPDTTATSSNVPASHHPPTTVGTGPKATNKAKSAFDLRANYKNTASSASRPLEVRRKTNATSIVLLEDNTLRNISAGPYASHFQTQAAYSADVANRENAPPLGVEEGLPAVSSSEWLAGPVGKKRHSAQAGTRKPSRYSPGKERGFGGVEKFGREGSPGQRLVTGWLEGRTRKSQESSPAPAFI